MGQQKSAFPISGSIGELTFYQSRHGSFVRKKGKVDKTRIATDPKFQKVRENIAEFSRSAKSGKLIRVAFRNLVKNAKDGDTATRMSKLLFSILKTDVTSEPGERQITKGNLALLDKFEFNQTFQIADSLYAPYNLSLDRTTGRVNIELVSFVPTQGLNAPDNAHHFRLTLGAAEFDFANNTQKYIEASSQQLPVNADPTDDIGLTAMLTPNSTGVIIVVLGLEFYEQRGTRITPLRPAALAILTINKP